MINSLLLKSIENSLSGSEGGSVSFHLRLHCVIPQPKRKQRTRLHLRTLSRLTILFNILNLLLTSVFVLL